jgi:transposase
MHYVPFLPLLELPHTKVSQDLRRAFSDCGLTDSDFQTVSLSELVAFALRSSSDHWAGLAVRWLSDGFPLDEAIARAGDEMVTAKRGSQADRHALFRMIRQWERSR